MPAIKHTAIVGRRDIYVLDPQQITVVTGFNPRQDWDSDDAKQSLAELEASIEANGVLEPIRVYRNGDTFELVNGERRLRACQNLRARGVEIRGIPAIIESQRLSDADKLLHALTANEGVPLSPLDEGRAYARLEAFGWPQKAIAAKTGHSASYVSSRLLLANGATPATQQALASGEITVSDATQLVRSTQGASDAVQDVLLKGKMTQRKVKRERRLPAEEKRENRFQERVFALVDEHGVEKVIDALITYSDLGTVQNYLWQKMQEVS